MHCGWMDETEWTFPIDLPCKVIGGKPSKGLDGVEWTEDICPGWAIRQPLIEEIGQAYQAYEKGCLGDAFPNPADCLVEGVLELQRACAHKERVMMAESEERQEQLLAQQQQQYE